MSDLAFPFTPRQWQQEHIFDPLSSTGTRAIVCLTARQIGKTHGSLAALCMGALTRAGRYIYVMPQRAMAKTIAWPRLHEFLDPIPGCEFRLGDLEVHVPCLAEPGKTSIISLHSGADQDQGGNIRGLTNVVGMAIDEAATISTEPFWGAIWPVANAVENPWALITGTARGIDLLSDLYHYAERTPGWHAARVTAEDSGCYTPERLAEIAAQMPPNLYAREMMCDLNVSEEDALIPLQDVIAAQARQLPPEHSSRNMVGMSMDDYRATNDVNMGLDLSFLATNDKTVGAIRIGPVMYPPIVWQPDSLQDIGRRVYQLVQEYGVDNLVVDSGGGGTFVASHLEDLGLRVLRANFGEKSPEEGFANLRVCLWDRLRRWIQDGGILPRGEHGDYVARQLSTPRVHRTATNKAQLEGKDSIRKRLGSSTDFGDAAAMTMYVRSNSKALTPEPMFGGNPRFQKGGLDPLVHYDGAGGKVYSSRAFRQRREAARGDQVYDPYSKENYEW